MKIAKNIKQHIDTISGKRRFTILNKYIKDNYKEPEYEMRNVVGEYSPKDIIEQLRTIVAYVKDLCARQGKNLSRYYSYARIQEIENSFASLASQFDGISDSSSKPALRKLLVASAEWLEIIKPQLGPFFDLRLDEAVQNITSEIVNHQEELSTIKDLAKEVSKQTSSINKSYEKSEESARVFEHLIKDTNSLNKQLESQQLAVKELHNRTLVVSNHINKLQEKLEEKITQIDKISENSQDMKERIEGEYYSVIERSREFEVVAARIEQAEIQAKNIIHQARHALNLSQGSGFLGSYKSLYEQSSKLWVHLPWVFGCVLGFLMSIVTITMSYLGIRELGNIREIFNFPYLTAQVIFIPISLFIFFFCLLQSRRRRRMQHKYHTRYAALEAYLKLSEHLPYDSPEQMRTASNIMRYLEEDFNPVAVRSMFNTAQFNTNSSFR